MSKLKELLVNEGYNPDDLQCKLNISYERCVSQICLSVEHVYFFLAFFFFSLVHNALCVHFYVENEREVVRCIIVSFSSV